MPRFRIWLTLVLLGLGLGIAQADAPPPVTIGFYMPVIRDVPRKDVEVSLRFWIEELANSINLTYKPVRFYDDLAELKQDMKAGTINFLVASSMGVVQHFSNEELADGFSGAKLSPDHLLFIVRRAAAIQRPSDLANKRFALLDRDELSEAYFETLLMKGKLDPGRLAAIKKEKRSSALVHQLFFNQGDAALINRNAYEAALALNPQIGERVQVLDEFSFKGQSPTVGLFSSRVAPEHREIITQAAMKIDKTARGRQVMEIYQTDSMVVSKVSDLGPYRELMVTHRTLKAEVAAAAAKKGNR